MSRKFQLRRNVSLKGYNTFGIEAFADYFVEVTSEEELVALLQDAELKKLPRLILGGGSNVLFTRNFGGLVIKNSIRGIEIIEEDEKTALVKAASGEEWHSLVIFAIERELGGIENLSLIPGTVGAAPMQNIGAYGVELKEVFHSLEAINLETSEKQTFDAPDCCFGYRESIFKKGLKDKFFITSVSLRLRKEHELNTSYGAIREVLDQMQVKEFTIKDVSNAVIQIRQSKLPDPVELGNAGSFFKNPEIPEAKYQELKSSFPEIPGYPTGEGKIKVPAAWLIEQCGWKGKVVGNTGSHKNQALVLVNYGNANGKEIFELAKEIQESVKEKFGIEIVPEVNVI